MIHHLLVFCLFLKTSFEHDLYWNPCGTICFLLYNYFVFGMEELPPPFAFILPNILHVSVIPIKQDYTCAWNTWPEFFFFFHSFVSHMNLKLKIFRWWCDFCRKLWVCVVLTNHPGHIWMSVSYWPFNTKKDSIV